MRILKPDTNKKKGLRYLEGIESTLEFLLSLKGHYTRKRIRWHCKDMRFRLRNARTLINKEFKQPNLDRITEYINGGGVNDCINWC